MTSDRRRAAETFYAPLATAGSAARRVGWDTAHAHRLRLEAVAEAAAPLGARASILDAGCGEAALLPVLRARGFGGRYRGEDVLASMIARAEAATAGDPLCELVASDSFGEGPEAEVVLCSGALNTAVGTDHDAEVAAVLTALWGRATALLAVDLAVVDRHPPGVGLARADLAKAWSLARTLAPVVSVREDVIPGEALLVLARSRAGAYARWVPDATLRAELLVAAGEPAAAAALVAGIGGPEAALVRGRAAALEGRLADAERALEDARALPHAALELAPIYWRTGRKAQAEALLRELARTHDEARAHLAMMLLGRGATGEARAFVEAIGDAWIRREVEVHALARAPKKG